MDLSKFLILIELLLLMMISILIRQTIGSSEEKPNRHRDKSEQCNEQQHFEIDKQFQLIQMFGENGRPFPTNLDEVETYCRETFKMMNQLEHFTRDCFHGRIENVAKMFLINLKRLMRTMCVKRKITKRVQTLLNIGPCLNEKIKQDNCLLIMANETKQLIAVVEEDQIKIQHTCCNYLDYLKCEQEFFDSLPCMDQNSKENLMDFIRSITQDSSHLGCSDYLDKSTESNFCQTLKSKSLAEHNPLNPMPTNMDQKLQSMFFTMISLIKSFKTFNHGNH